MSSIRRLERVLNELGPDRRSSRRISGKSILEVRSDKIPDSLLQAIIDGRWRTGITSVKGHFIRVDLPKDVAEEYNLGSYSYAYIEVSMGVRDDETISRVKIDVGDAYQTSYNNRQFSRNSVVGRLFGKIEKEIYRVIDTGRTKFDAFTNKSPRVVRRGRYWGSESRRRLRVSKGRRSLREAIGDIPDYIIDGSFVVPDGVTEIRDYAFKDCTNLESIIIPESVTKIGFGAFYRCKRLKNITLPESVTEIGEGAFYGCYSLKNITLPEGVTKIGGGAFYRCCYLKNITLPESVTKIGNMAFAECNNLTSIVIPDSVTEIGDHAFYGCTNLKKVSLPKKVKFGIGVFHDCHTDLKIIYRD